MRVIMVSNDSTALGSTSKTALRIEEYRQRVDELVVVVRGHGTYGGPGGSDVVVTAQDPFFAGLEAWKIARRIRAPLHLQLHGDFFGPHWRRLRVRNRFYLMLARFLIRRATGFRVVSERIARSLVALGIPRSCITVAPIVSDGHYDTTEHQSAGRGVVFLVLAALTKEKNVGLAIRAFKNAGLPNARLIVVGDGPERRALEQAGVELVGHVSDPDPWYHRADVFVMTSMAEGWGRTAAEAIAHGLPVVMTDVGLAGEFVRDGVNGLVVPVGDEQALVEAIRRIGTDGELRARLAEGAQQTKIPARSETIDLMVKSWQNTLT